MCRLNAYKQFKEGQKRLLVATDLIGRGIDIERVNIVINYDMPETDERHGNGADTYLHRVSHRLAPALWGHHMLGRMRRLKCLAPGMHCESVDVLQSLAELKACSAGQRICALDCLSDS